MSKNTPAEAKAQGLIAALEKAVNEAKAERRRRCVCGHPQSDHRRPNLGNRICGVTCPCAVFRAP